MSYGLKSIDQFYYIDKKAIIHQKGAEMSELDKTRLQDQAEPLLSLFAISKKDISSCYNTL